MPFVDNLVNVYPNPLENELQLESSENGTIQIFDLLGGVVFEQKVNEGREMLDLGRLNSGTYFLKFFNESAQQIEKIIKN